MKAHLFSYSHEGARYSFELPAESMEDAKRRVRSLLVNGCDYDGELVAKVPAYLPAAGQWVRLATWLRNLFRGDRNG